MPTPKELSRLRPMLRKTFAEIVHRSVCEITESDGFGHCFLYAVGGFTLVAGEKLRPMPHPQAGSLLIQPDPAEPDHWFMLDASDGGPTRGEYHTWLMAEDGTIIDFSARHYRRYAEALLAHSGVIEQGPAGVVLELAGGDRPAWKRADHPDYLWGHARDIPPWVRFRTDPAACESFNDRFTRTFRSPEMDAFRSLVWRNYKRLMPR